MKKTVLLLFIALTCILSCSKANDALDALDGVGCINTLTKLSDNEDDLSCSELTAELNKIERSCSEFLDDETRAYIVLIKASCTDD